MVYVVRLPSLEFLRREVKMWGVSEEESKYGHKIRMVSPTSIKIVRKAVKILRGEMIMAGTQTIQKPVKLVTFSSV